ncbi:hypothetical protein MNBD_GAMMA21-1788 [hydrothermal vent metagenome]|uniref:Uncharacterized protein n=1 Tax=hydrothermal vent metagenome TaxID=652676 RepID=A0A3B0ZBF4_9ZZZZ
MGTKLNGATTVHRCRIRSDVDNVVITNRNYSADASNAIASIAGTTTGCEWQHRPTHLQFLRIHTDCRDRNEIG